MVKKVKNIGNNNFLHYIIYYIILIIVMVIFQYKLDKNRHISYHCLIRNMLILTVILLKINNKISTIQAVAIVLFAEIIIEVFHQKGYSLDPYDYKIINFYRWADTLWNSKTVKIMDTYTEGKHDGNPHIHVKHTMKPKFEWMAKEGKIDSNSSVLEIGCGNGEFLRYLRDDLKCKNIVGVTLSPEQDKYLSNQGYNIVLSSIWDLPNNLNNKFDAIILNGSTEHFLNCTEDDTRFNEMFEVINRCLNPKSRSKRVVITCIHLHRPFSIYEYFQGYLLERTYGGKYPSNKNTYVDIARKYNMKLVKQENKTMDYYIWARKIWWNVLYGLREPNTLLNSTIDVPVFLLNDPYYIQKILHIIFQTWSWQFDVPFFPVLSYDDTPPMYHEWLVFEK
jgi:cyclopropane fatty-acyl-phospholipid synthase-like methyltransferase